MVKLRCHDSTHSASSSPTALPFQLLANVPRKAEDDGPDAWAHATHLGDWDGVPGSQLWPAPAMVLEAIYEVNH